MAYIFNAMTNLAIDVRFMAFNFFDLVVQYYPPSFSLYAEKILQNYEDILRKNRVYLQDKGRLKNAFSGLVRCLSLLPCNMREDDSSEKNVSGRGILHAFEPDMPTESAGFSLIIKKLNDLVPVLHNCFQDFFPSVHTMPLLDAQSFDCVLAILQSINIAVRIFVYGTYKGVPGSQSSYGGSDVKLWDQTTSSIIGKKLLSAFPLNPTNHISEKDDDRCFILNIIITEIFLHFSELIFTPTDLLDRYLEFMENALLGKICSGTRFGKAVREKYLLSLLHFIPKLVSQVGNNWKSRLLQAFTKTFRDCNPESQLKLACLSSIEEMLIPKQHMPYLDGSNPEVLDHQINWIRELPQLLILLGDKYPSCSEVVLRLQLRLGQRALSNSFLVTEYNNMQYSLSEFYSTCEDSGNILYGPFIRLARDSQELSVCCLYYFSELDSLLLKSIASCCLCNDLEPFVLFRIIEVLHSAYKSGHIKIADHISFFITLISRFKVFPGNIYPGREFDAKISNCGTFKSVTSVVCSCLSQMGDNYLIFQILEKLIVDQILLKAPLDNVCAILRMLITLDDEPTRLSGQSIINLSNFLLGYLIDVMHCVPEDDDETSISIRIRTRGYYLLPCFFLFDRSHKLMNLVLIAMGSLINESSSLLHSHNFTRYATDRSSRITSIVSVVLLMHKDVKLQRIITPFKAEIECILQNLLFLESSKDLNMTIEERHKLQCGCDRLRILLSTLPNELQTT